MTRLNENGQFGVSPLQLLLDSLVNFAETSIRVLVTGHGARKGRKPKWLSDSTNFTVVGISQDSTEIEISAPTLREAVYEFQHQDFWLIKPEFDDTALDIMSLAVHEIQQSYPPGNRIDESVVQAIASFKRVVNQPTINLTIHPLEGKGRPIELDFEVIDRAHQRLRESIAPQNKAAKFNPETIVGKWPGDETIEELMEMLDELDNKSR